MIVADTNVLAYLWLPGTHTPQAEAALRRDAEWAVPLLWRSEFRSVLAGHLRRKSVDRAAAERIASAAETFFRGREYAVPSSRVFDLVAASPCSAYDCEYVALAEDLHVPLVTTDREILCAFPRVAVRLVDFAAGANH